MLLSDDGEHSVIQTSPFSANQRPGSVTTDQWEGGIKQAQVIDLADAAHRAQAPADPGTRAVTRLDLAVKS